MAKSLRLEIYEGQDLRLTIVDLKISHYHLHVKRIRKCSDHRSNINKDDLDDGLPVGDDGVDVGHCHQPVQGDGCQTQGGHVD